jgi:hypothetical protein
MIEEWRDIVGYEGLYEVSNTGLIRSVHRVIVRSTGNKHTVKPKILKPHPDKKGYLRTALSGKGKLRTVKVHREVAKAFHNNPHNKETVNHKDCNKKNNSASNLEWMTNLENYKHAKDNGMQDKSIENLVRMNKLRWK